MGASRHAGVSRDGHLWTDHWNGMIADSKFPDFNPDFADVAKTGYIGLQDHGHAVRFRNIKIWEM